MHARFFEFLAEFFSFSSFSLENNPESCGPMMDGLLFCLYAALAYFGAVYAGSFIFDCF